MTSKVTPIEAVSGALAITRVVLPLEAPPRAEEPSPEIRRPQPSPPTPGERLELDGSLSETHAQFLYDESSQLVQVKIVDTATNRVVREIPPEALVKLAATLRAYQDAAAYGPKAMGPQG